MPPAQLHTPAGVVAAAAGWVVDLHTKRYQGADQLGSLVQRIGTGDQAVALIQQRTNANRMIASYYKVPNVTVPGLVMADRAAGWQLAGYGSVTATVRIWSGQQRGLTHATGTLGVRTWWQTTTLQLRWTVHGWRIAAVAEALGPQPGTDAAGVFVPMTRRPG